MISDRILDTMTVSYLMKGEPTATARLESCNRAHVYLCQPVISEIQFGLFRMPSSKRRERLTYRFQLLASQLHRAEWDDEVSRHFGIVKTTLEKRGTPLEDFDIAIACQALARDAILVTCNLSHMDRVPGLKLESWGS